MVTGPSRGSQSNDNGRLGLQFRRELLLAGLASRLPDGLKTMAFCPGPAPNQKAGRQTLNCFEIAAVERGWRRFQLPCIGEAGATRSIVGRPALDPAAQRASRVQGIICFLLDFGVQLCALQESRWTHPLWYIARQSWYPTAISTMAVVIGMHFVADTFGPDLHAKQ
jgi:hypothetical protein